MKSKVVLSSLLACVTLGGCASIKFYNEPELGGKEQGLKFYYPKPYLLVARDGTSKVTSITVQYLPDLAHPVYAKANAGYGASNLTLAFSNGTITSFGQQVDTKVPETLSALGTLIPGYGSAMKSLEDAAAEKKASDAPAKQASDLPGDAKTLMAVADSLRSLAGSASFTGSQPAAMRLIANTLYVGPNGAVPASGIAARLNAPGAATALTDIVKDLKAADKQFAALKAPDSLGEAAKTDWGKVVTLQSQLGAVIKDLSSDGKGEASVPVLTLYEIIMDGQTTNLKEVPLPPSLTK